MINRYNGSTGRMVRVPEAADLIGDTRPPQSPPISHQARHGTPLPKLAGIAEGLPDKLSRLETEDMILLLILYLMYRESGDSELLMIMGAWFLL